MDNSINSKEAMRQEVYENNKVSSLNIQSGNQLDYQRREQTLDSGLEAAPCFTDLDCASTSEDSLRSSQTQNGFNNIFGLSISLSVKRTIRKQRRQRRSRKQRHEEENKFSASKFTTLKSLRPGAPHNTNEFLSEELSSRLSITDTSSSNVANKSIFDSMIGLISSKDLTCTEQVLDTELNHGQVVVSEQDKCIPAPYPFNSISEDVMQGQHAGETKSVGLKLS